MPADMLHTGQEWGSNVDLSSLASVPAPISKKHVSAGSIYLKWQKFMDSEELLGQKKKK